MSILNENPYDLPLDERELVRALLPELPTKVVRWLKRRAEAERNFLDDLLHHRDHDGKCSR